MTMNAFAAGIEAALHDGLSKPAPGSLEQHAEFHRKAASEYEVRKATARREGKAATAAFRAERKELRDRFNADLAAIDEREAVSKAELAERTATAECLADVSRTAAKKIEACL
jgi:septal ring-binding cell division protein DamX